MVYSIWSEGYSCTGEHATAAYHGDYEGETFKDACIKWGKEKVITTFDVEKLTYWGCQLFDNEIDARKAFG